MKRKVNLNRPEISADEINQRKNFDSVLKNNGNISAKPLIKKPWFLSSLVVATIAIIAIVVVSNNSSKIQQNKISTQTVNSDSLDLAAFYKAEESKPCIAPPIKGLNIPYTSFKVNAEKGASLNFKTGSKLTVPKNAFVDENGKPVVGEVELRYREFHDAADFFVSGIPMTYDSAGVKYQFESAGMMEMLAYQNGKEVNMAPGKSINIELASEYKGTEYNLYKLDTVKNNWSCLGKDKVVENPNQSLTSNFAKTDSVKSPVKVEETPAYKTIETKKVEAKSVKENQISELPKPLPEPKKPVKVDKNKYVANLDLDLKDFPEFAVYKDVQWELSSENKGLNENMFSTLIKTEWDDVVLKEGSKKGENYFMTLKKGSKKIENLIVYPVFEGKSYETAMKNFQEKFSKYEIVLEKRKVNEKKIEEEYQAKIIALNKQQKELEEKWKREMDKKLNALSTEEKVMRVFAISSFGVYNSDNPSHYPTGISCRATLANEQNNHLRCYDVYLVDKKKNGLFAYYKNPITVFSFDPKSTNLLWTVDNGVLYYLPSEKFDQLTNGTQTINLTKVDQQFKTVDEMKAFFNL